MSVDTEDFAQRRIAAAEELNRHENRTDGTRVTDTLSMGLTLLRDLFYARVHDDVQRRVGIDSMLMPVSAERTERVAKLEIELYEIAVSTVTAVERGYVATPEAWYMPWLGKLRLGSVGAEGKTAKRLAAYLAGTPDNRRLLFSNVLAAALPESRRAPLVLFRLLPPAIQIVTAMAFDDEAGAAKWREQQAQYLPAVFDCHYCDGRVLDNGQVCPDCANPLWKFEWLTRAD